VFETVVTGVQEAIIEPVFQYVKDSLRHQTWQKRHVTVLSLGIMLDGRSPDTLKQMVFQIIPDINDLLSDCISGVQRTAAWTTNRILKVFPQVPGGDLCVPDLLKAMITKVAIKAANHNFDGPGQLCPSFEDIVDYIRQLINRPEYEKAKKLTYSSLSVMIKKISPDFNKSIEGRMVLRTLIFDLPGPLWRLNDEFVRV
jgi:hypothetical protein